MGRPPSALYDLIYVDPATTLVTHGRGLAGILGALAALLGWTAWPQIEAGLV